MTVSLQEYTAPVSSLVPGFKPQAAIGWNSALTTGYGLSGAGAQAVGWWAKQPYPSVGQNQYVSAAGQDVFFIGHINDANRCFQEKLDGSTILAGDGLGNAQEIVRAGCSRVTMNSHDSNAHGVLFLGGRAMKAKVGTITFSATGSQSVTGLGFQPQLLMFHSAKINGFDCQFGGAFSVGATDGTNQWALAWDSPYGIDGDIDPGKMQTGVWRNDLCAVSVANPSLLAKVEITSMDADGFTVNVIAADANSTWSYLALYDADGEFAVGEGTQDDADITVGFAAEAMLFASGGQVNHALYTNFAGSSFGGASPTEEVGGCTYQRINNADRYWNSSALSMINTGTLGPSLKAEMSVSAWNATTVDLDWTTSDAGSRLFGWIAFRTTGKRQCGHPLPRLNAGR